MVVNQPQVPSGCVTVFTPLSGSSQKRAPTPLNPIIMTTTSSTITTTTATATWSIVGVVFSVGSGIGSGVDGFLCGGWREAGFLARGELVCGGVAESLTVHSQQLWVNSKERNQFAHT